MQELIKNLVEKAGLSEETAGKALTTTVEYLKEKLPSFMHGSLDKAFNGETLTEGLKDQFSDLAGDAKEKASELAGDLKEGAEKIVGDLKETLGGFFGGKKD